MRFVPEPVLTILLIGLIAASCAKDDSEGSARTEVCFEVDVEESLENNHEFQFISCSENAIAYAWDFGDGEESTHRYPKHVYSEYGSYEVTLTITNEMGAHLQKSTTVKYGHYGIESLSFREVNMDGSKSPPYYYTGCLAGVRALDGLSAAGNMSYGMNYNGTGDYHPIPEKTTLVTGIEYVLVSSPTNMEVLWSGNQKVEIDLSESLEYKDVEFVWNESNGSKIIVDATFKKVFKPESF